MCCGRWALQSDGCIRAAQEVVEAAGYGFGLYVGLYVYKERWLDF